MVNPSSRSGVQRNAHPQVFNKSTTFVVPNKEIIVAIKTCLQDFSEIISHIVTILWMLIKIRLLMPYIL